MSTFLQTKEKTMLHICDWHIVFLYLIFIFVFVRLFSYFLLLSSCHFLYNIWMSIHTFLETELQLSWKKFRKTDGLKKRQTDKQTDQLTDDFVTEGLTQWPTDCLINSQRDWLNDRMNEWQVGRKTDRQRKEKDHGGKKLESKTRGKGVNEWKRKLSKEVTMQVVKWATINKICVIKILTPKVMRKS